MSTQMMEPERADYQHYHQYRAISTLAVVSLGLALLSPLAFLEWILGVVPILGVGLGLAAMRQIRRRPDELGGFTVAAIGVILSASLLLSGWSWQAFVYATEVPEGHERISFDHLRQPRGEQWQGPPADAQELDGKRVFIKGYMYPGSSTQVKEFLLCRDNGDCCFGGTPAPSDMILVKMKNPEYWEYSKWRQKVWGTFRVMPANMAAEGGLTLTPVYQLEVELEP